MGCYGSNDQTNSVKFVTSERHISLLLRKHTTPPQPFYGPFFQDHPGELVPEENYWTLWCKGRQQRQTYWPSG